MHLPLSPHISCPVGGGSAAVKKKPSKMPPKGALKTRPQKVHGKGPICGIGETLVILGAQDDASRQ